MQFLAIYYISNFQLRYEVVYDYEILQFWQFVIFEICNFDNLQVFLKKIAISEVYDFCNMPFCQFYILPFLQSAILTTYNFCNLCFWKYVILKNLRFRKSADCDVGNLQFLQSLTSKICFSGNLDFGNLRLLTIWNLGIQQCEQFAILTIWNPILQSVILKRSKVFLRP